MGLRQRLGLLAGIAILVFGSVLLETSLGRIYTVLFGHPVAVMVLPLALLGVGVGAIMHRLFPGVARPPVLFARLGELASLAAAATLATLLVVLHSKVPQTLDGAALPWVGLLVVITALPWVFIGMALGAVLRHAARTVAWVGFALGTGAAFAGMPAMVLLRVGALRVPLVVGLLDGLAVLTFYRTARSSTDTPSSPTPRVHSGVVATVLLASCVLLLGDLGAPWLKLPGLRWAALDKVETLEWTSRGLVTVDKAVGSNAWLRTDGTMGVPMVEGNSPVSPSADEVAYTLHKDPGRVLILGAGGGREVRIAQKLGKHEIIAVEPNSVIANRLMGDRYKTWSGALFDRPRVHLEVDDLRGFLRRTQQSFQLIVVPLKDTQGPAAAGALAAVPEDLLTVEALHDALVRLAPQGMLVVSRWDSELDPLLALVAEALRTTGVSEPSRHLYACSSARSTAMMVARAPLTVSEIAELRTQCRRSKFVEAFAPDHPHGELRRRLTSERVRDVAASEPMAGSVPTSDRPYFFDAGRRHPLGATLAELKGLTATRQGLGMLVAVLVFAALVYVVGTLSPLIRTAHEHERGARLVPLLFCSAMCAALALTVVAFAERFPVILGHPGHAVATVFVVLIAFAGAGSLLAGRLNMMWVEQETGQRAQILVLLLSGCASALGSIADDALELPFAGRLLFLLMTLGPLGFLLGSTLVLGLRIVAVRAASMLSWCFGTGALAASVASALGLLVAVQWGVSAVFLVAGCASFLAAALVPRMRPG